MSPFSPVSGLILVFEDDGLAGPALIYDGSLNAGSLHGGLTHGEIITISDKEDSVQFNGGTFLAFYLFNFNCLPGANPMLLSSG